MWVWKSISYWYVYFAIDWIIVTQVMLRSPSLKVYLGTWYDIIHAPKCKTTCTLVPSLAYALGITKMTNYDL